MDLVTWDAVKHMNPIEALYEFAMQHDLEGDLIQFSPYHFRLKTKKCTIDLWPTSGSFRIDHKSPTQRYLEINELEKYI